MLGFDEVSERSPPFRRDPDPEVCLVSCDHYRRCRRVLVAALIPFSQRPKRFRFGHIINKQNCLGPEIEIRPVPSLALDVPDREANIFAVDLELLRRYVNTKGDVTGFAELALGVLADERCLSDISFSTNDDLQRAHSTVLRIIGIVQQCRIFAPLTRPSIGAYSGQGQ
jgi:hypothetical protein